MGRRRKGKRRKGTHYSGVFQCDCDNIWISYDIQTSEIEDYFEECLDCRSVTIGDIIDTSGFIAVANRKYFGQFKCYQCLRTWCSAHSWLGSKQMCRTCMVWINPFKLRRLEKPEGMNRCIDQKKRHEIDLCSMCRLLGDCCKRYIKLF